MEQLKTLFPDNEDWLTERVLGYAKRQGYAEYTSALVEAWRLSIVAFTEAIGQCEDDALETVLEFSPDDMFEDDPVSRFAVQQARIHRERGFTLPVYFGILKYYRQTYYDCILLHAEETLWERHRKLVGRFFDRVEIASCADWSDSTTTEKLDELRACNLAMTIRQNKLLTLFESAPTSVFILDENREIEFMNRTAAEFLGLADDPGELSYARHATTDTDTGEKPSLTPLRDIAPWLDEAMEVARPGDSGDCRFDVSASTALGPRHFSVSTSDMADISDTFTGHAVILDDITFRVDMEHQLAQERNRATHYLDIVGSIIVVLDASGGITLINSTGCRVLGYEEHELIGRNWIDLVVPNEQKDEVRDYLYHVFSEGGESTDEHINYVTTKDGRDRLIAWNNRLLRNESGIPVGILSSGTDITEQRAAEDALAEKELWLRNTFVALGEAVLILTPDSHIIDANPAAETMFGLTNDEFVNLHAEALHIDAEHFHTFSGITRAAFDKGETANFEFELRRMDGESFPTEHAVSLIIGDDGAPLGIVSVIRDISSRKKAEKELRQSEEKFRRIFESIQEGYIVTNLEGKILMVNPATCTLLGYKENEIIGTDMDLLYSDAEERTRFRSILAAQGSVRGYQLTAKRKNGFPLVVEANAHMVLDSKGLPVAMEGTFHDISHRIEAEKVLREREKLYRAFFENNHAIMLLVEPRSGHIVDANPAASSFYGYSCDEMRTMRMNQINTLSEKEIYEEMTRSKKEKRAYFIFKHTLANGEVRDVEVYSGPIMVKENQLLYSVIHDVTERVRLEREMKRLATTDTLTGTNNRHQFFTRAAQELKRALRYRHPLTVLMLDIDYFKSINDTHGHQTGDVVLKALAAMALNTLRETDVFGRLGGEEFAAVLPETGLKAGMYAAERLRDGLSKLMVRAQDAEVTFTVSIGVTLARRDDKTIEDVLNRADEALYKAKRMGRNRVEKG